ncbi:MAG: DUF6186 family protein [Acidimicrobiales bacterium]
MNLALWVIGGAAIVSCEVASRRLDHGWPTAVQLLARARGHLGGRVALVLAWLWLGWHVFAR